MNYQAVFDLHAGSKININHGILKNTSENLKVTLLIQSPFKIPLYLGSLFCSESFLSQQQPVGVHVTKYFIKW